VIENGDRPIANQPNWPGEPEPRRRRRLEHERRGPAELGHHPLQSPRARAARLEQTHPYEQAQERGRHQPPQDLLPEAAHVLVDEEDVQQRADHQHHRQHGVHDVPRLVGEPERAPPDRRGDQGDQREQRGHAEPHQQRRRQRLGGRHLVPPRRDREVEEDERQPGVADLAVELQQRVLAERRRQGPEARDERELEPHHRQPDEAERDREVRPEAVVRPTAPMTANTTGDRTAPR
jgi:hypothetical protein